MATTLEAAPRGRVAERAVDVVQAPQQGLATLGQQLAFYVKVLAWVPRTAVHYPREILRLLSDVFFGSGALAVIGGTLGVMIGMTVFTGLIVGLQGYSALNQLGTSALTGFIAAYFNTREVAPLAAGLALSATVGCGGSAVFLCGLAADHRVVLRAVGRHLRPLLPPVPTAG